VIVLKRDLIEECHIMRLYMEIDFWD